MLKIFNDLKPFFEDCYREISVREYSRETGISPPTASKLLKDFEKEGLLIMRGERGFLLFRANRESEELKDFSRIYWRNKLKKLFEFLSDEFHSPTIILFGSLAKLEVIEKSDIDLVLLTEFKKNVDLSKFKKQFGREIQIFKFKSIKEINKELQLNVLEGYLIQGVLK